MLSHDVVVQLLHTVYALHPTTITSLDQYHFDWRGLRRITTSDGQAWVLRLVRHPDAYRSTSDTASVLIWLADQHYPAPRMYSTTSGTLVGQLDRWCCLLLSFVDGATIVQQRWEEMLTIVEETWRQVVPVWGNTVAIGMSLACYLFAGHPSPHDRGCYGSLQMLTPDLATFMQAQVTRRLQANLEVRVVHDGTAAAAVYAGHKHMAVLTLGTAIGNGFPPSTEGYRPLAPTFQVH